MECSFDVLVWEGRLTIQTAKMPKDDLRAGFVCGMRYSYVCSDSQQFSMQSEVRTTLLDQGETSCDTLLVLRCNLLNSFLSSIMVPSSSAALMSASHERHIFEGL